MSSVKELARESAQKIKASQGASVPFYERDALAAIEAMVEREDSSDGDIFTVFIDQMKYVREQVAADSASNSSFIGYCQTFLDETSKLGIQKLPTELLSKTLNYLNTEEISRAR